MFYPAAPVVPAGSNVTICYGVENAQALVLEPPVEDLKPVFNRCFSAPVPRNTVFRLTAIGFDGKEASASFTVMVGASERDEGVGPAPRAVKILTFTAEPARISRSSPPPKLCYQVMNARSVKINPQVTDLGSVQLGCFYAPTERTTTYTLTATGANGTVDQRRVTVMVE